MIKRLSLHARLLILALVTGMVALLFASFVIGHVLEGFVRHNLDEKLDTQIAILARAIPPDGKLDQSHVVNLPGFDVADQGWGWRIDGPSGHWASGEPLTEMALPFFAWDDHEHPHGDHWDRARTQHGDFVYTRQRDIQTLTGIIRITAAGPLHLTERPMRAAMTPLLLAMGLLALGLAAAALIQLRLGLRPLRLLRNDIIKVRNGVAQRLSEDQPKELRPLAMEVNALIEQNAAGLADARRHVSNLAHGLKTPLATLAMRLERQNADSETQALVDQLDVRISHHLKRARSGATVSGNRAVCQVTEVANGLVLALNHIYAEHYIIVDKDIEAAIAVAIDRQDLDEMLGNLLDNAFRHAKSRVRLTARSEANRATIIIEDDGAGISEDEMPFALKAGSRLDESSVGFGFGLSIVRELAELYGGQILLGRSDLGGLSAQIELPRHIGDNPIPI